MTWPKNVSLQSTSPRGHKGAKRGQPREAKERKVVQKHVYDDEIVYFDSPCAETLDPSIHARGCAQLERWCLAIQEPAQFAKLDFST